MPMPVFLMGAKSQMKTVAPVTVTWISHDWGNDQHQILKGDCDEMVRVVIFGGDVTTGD